MLMLEVPYTFPMPSNLKLAILSSKLLLIVFILFKTIYSAKNIKYILRLVLKYLTCLDVEIDVIPHDPNQGSPSASIHLQNIEEQNWKKHLVQH